MEHNEKFYDAVLTEGARWLAALYERKGPLVVYGAERHMCFMDIARVVSSYDVVLYFRMPWWRFIYLRYFKRFKFLKRPQSAGFQVYATTFQKELASFFKTTPEELARLCRQYGICR